MGAKLIGMSEDSQRSAGYDEHELALINDPAVPPAIRARFTDLEAKEHRDRLRNLRMLILRNRIEVSPEVMEEAVVKAAEMLRGNDGKSRREAMRFLKDVATHNLNVDRALMEVVTQERDAEPRGEGLTAEDMVHVMENLRAEMKRADRGNIGPAVADPPAPPEAEPAGDEAQHLSVLGEDSFDS